MNFNRILQVFVWFFNFTCFYNVSCNLGDRVKRFSLFSHNNVKHHINKRDIYTQFPDTRRLEFVTLGKKFKLELKRDTSLFTNDFRVTVVDGKGSRRDVLVHPNLYHGHVQGDPTSTVEAIFSKNNLFMGKVQVDNENYLFEPSWRHFENNSNLTMIGYKEEDVNYSYDLGERFCEKIQPPLDDNYDGATDMEADYDGNDGATIIKSGDDDGDDDDEGSNVTNNNNRHQADNHANYNQHRYTNHHNNNNHNNDKIKNNNIHNNNIVNNYNNKPNGDINNNNDNNYNENVDNDNNNHNNNNNDNNNINNNNNNKNGKKRDKRQSSSSLCSKDNKNTCTIMLVADYKFFVNMGNSDVEATTGYMISVIDQVNQIYTKQVFGTCGVGYQFEIREIVVHDSYSDGSDPIYEYNMDMYMNTSNLLEYFSRNPHNKDFCLAHLFTYSAFDTGVLGLAYIGSSKKNTRGGVGTIEYYSRGRQLYINTGWSSSVNKYGRKLLTAEAYLVTAHELGHNWGSDHDMDTDECSPSKHGKYIMYMFSVSGREENNKEFSPCSRRSMGNLIREKADSYFSRKSGSFCGNYKVESGEQCDEGPDNKGGEGARCCYRCKFTRGSQCSDLNEECCQNCTYAPPTMSCTGEQDFGCKTSSKCSGKDTTCLPAANKPDGTECISNGHCRGGKCLTLCEYNNKQPCICPDLVNACKWCCQTQNDDSTCSPFGKENLNLPPGTPCLHGFCDKKGVCIKQEVQNTVQRLWRIIENIDANQLVLFMRANIVGTVIILSLIVWIPASCVVAAVDRKRAERQKEEYAWFSQDNDKLLLPSENLKIKKIDEIRTTKFRGPV